MMILCGVITMSNVAHITVFHFSTKILIKAALRRRTNLLFAGPKYVDQFVTVNINTSNEDFCPRAQCQLACSEDLSRETDYQSVTTKHQCHLLEGTEQHATFFLKVTRANKNKWNHQVFILRGEICNSPAFNND